MTSEHERFMNGFNLNTKGCKRRPNCKPQIAYDPGCEFIRCEHADCRCAINNGDGGTTSGFIAKWEATHGR
jgi:hypothetical protein